MKYAVIGTSWITQSYVKAAAYTGLWELHAVCSRNYEKGHQFACQFGASVVYTSIQQLAADQHTQAVYIASPNSLHYEQSKLMLQNGKHVICEKPATVTTEEYEELKALADERGLIYMEAIMSMHVPAFAMLHKLLPELGKIAAVHFDFCQLSSKYPLLCDGQNPNIFNPAFCTGALMDLGVYNLYLIAALFGMPDQILSASHYLPTGADNTTSGICIYPDYHVDFLCTKTGQGFSRSEIVGDKGTITIDSISQLTGIVHSVKNGTSIELVPIEVDRTEIMSHESISFHRFITNEEAYSTEYAHLHKTALIVRKMCDQIRKNNSFPF